ncbi:unnamed protein product [Rotaria sordida]|uniref:Uncharacterized protein n=2 Tax=Rotaria sordida TaxID=392033 RepID=A0A813YTJ3_9BILA|nr:unnamed protein product [Rotaria sordida]CAF1363595.1 unnamed protein product [Rotaria sordida]
MTDNSMSFTKDNFNSIIEELENTMQRSQLLASQAHHINTLQTKQIEQCQTTMDKSSKHLKDVEHEIDELQRNFCIRLCCPSKSKKFKSKNSSLIKSQENKSNENLVHIAQDRIYSNDQLQNVDENLQRLQYFNTLIDNEIQDQIQTLVCFRYTTALKMIRSHFSSTANDLHNKVDVDIYKLTKANSKSYRISNNNVELVMCLSSDPKCNKPLIQNTVNNPGFGQARLRLTFTQEDPLCEQGLSYSRVSLPFNLTGKAYCKGTSINVTRNHFEFSTWLTLCELELNLYIL